MPVLEQARTVGADVPATAEKQPTMVQQMFGLHAVLLLAVMALVLVAVPRTVADPDIWWHLRNAQEMLTHHAFVRQDVFTFTVHGAPWIDHEWLSELPFYLGWKTAGTTGVYTVTVLVVELIFASLLWLCWRASGSAVTACVSVVLAALISTVSFGPRTLLFGWLCLCAELIVLERFRTRARAILALPVLFLLWVNLHGSWMIGLCVLGIVTVTGHLRLQHGWIAQERFSRAQRRLLMLAWAGVVPALLCNPWGWRLVAYPFNFAFHQALNVASVEEWHSLDLHSFRGRIVLAALLSLVGKQFWQPRRWSLQELVLVAVGFYSAFTYTRFLFLLALLASPVIARSFPGRDAERSKPTLRYLNAVLMLLIVLVACAWIRKPRADAAMVHYPAAALQTLDGIPPGSRVLSEFLWGGYLEFYRRERPAFIDSRIDIFEYSGVFKDYLDIIHIKDTLRLLDSYRIDYVFFERDTPLVYVLQNSGAWTTTYRDDQTVLLKRATHPGKSGCEGNGTPCR